MEVKCPHCGKTIDLVGAKELKEDFGLGPNSVQHARSRGRFPAPWLSFGNRQIFLRDVIRGYVEERSRATIERSLDELLPAASRLSDKERQEALRLLEERLGAKAPPRKRRKT
jgi:hypothetical protein